jgi:galactose mutarotase-like enzyme
VLPESPDWVRLHNAELLAAIDPLGAQLSVLRDAHGHDLLWHGDPAWWSGRAPILFPIVGSLNGGCYRWKGRQYTMPRHGFARGRRFNLVQHDIHNALFQLRDDEETRAIYPFAFELEVAFRLEGWQLSVEASVRNAGEEPMPASLGFHPAFRWPLPWGQPRSAHFLEFDADEPGPVRRLDRDGLLTPARQETPVSGTRLALHDALFTEDVLIFDGLNSHTVVYGAEEGPRVRIDIDDSQYLGVWTRPGAGFLCIEPWRGVADPAGFCGELDAKPGISVLAPGERLHLSMRIECLREG